MGTRRFVFGKPPFRFLADHLAQDADFQNDAQPILKLDEDAYLRLATQLAKTDAFLSRSDLASIVGDVLGEGELSEQIASIIYRIGGILHDVDDMDATAAMNALGEAIEENAETFEPQERRTLSDRLRRLAAEPIGIAKQYKARQLVSAIGAELDDFRIICDIRPIFDQNRGQIEGAIPIAILRLEFTKQDGESAVVEVRITEKQIGMFGEKIADAGLKLKIIKELLKSQQLRIPKTKSTVSEEQS